MLYKNLKARILDYFWLILTVIQQTCIANKIRKCCIKIYAGLKMNEVFVE